MAGTSNESGMTQKEVNELIISSMEELKKDLKEVKLGVNSIVLEVNDHNHRITAIEKSREERSIERKEIRLSKPALILAVIGLIFAGIEIIIQLKSI